MAANRRERRAQAQAQAQAQARSKPSANSNDIKLVQPPRTPLRSKTLLDIAAERELLGPNGTSSSIDPSSVTTTTINPDGSLSEPVELSNTDFDAELDTEPTPYLDIFLYTSTLICLNFTLTFLVHYQYALSPPRVLPLFLSSTVFSPTPLIILSLVATLHHRAAQPLVQVLFAGMSVLAGGWLVHATNEDPYLAVMKKAPALGTLWVWSTVEMKWEWAAGCLAMVGAWGWWRGYAVF